MEGRRQAQGRSARVGPERVGHEPRSTNSHVAPTAMPLPSWSPPSSRRGPAARQDTAKGSAMGSAIDTAKGQVQRRGLTMAPAMDVSLHPPTSPRPSLPRLCPSSSDAAPVNGWCMAGAASGGGSSGPGCRLEARHFRDEPSSISPISSRRPALRVGVATDPSGGGDGSAGLRRGT